MNTDEMRKTLQELRIKAGYSQNGVGKALEWSGTKVLRIENGPSYVTPSDVQRMLELYRVTDIGLINKLMSAARASKQRTNRLRSQVVRKSYAARTKEGPAECGQLHAVGAYTHDILTLVCAINEQAKANDPDGVAAAIHELTQHVQRGGRQLVQTMRMR